MSEHYEVLIVGAGLSGIGTACHLAKAKPGRSMAIIERRNAIGGTWDLFRYPGIRSDSDMFSFGYSFRPWHALKVLADGPSIRQYVVDTAREYGVEDKIHFGLKTTQAEWSSESRRWTVTTLHEASGETRRFTCNFLVSCTGYYNYDKGYLPDFPGVERFKGTCIHPQHWPEKLDYRGKRVVIIGSGATAVTLVPAMAPDAAHVTMLQRSPSYIFSVPAYDAISAFLNRILPQRWVYAFARKRNILIQRWLYEGSRRWPNAFRRFFLSGVRRQLGKDFDMRHFTPSYQPWDERLCAVPDADLFKAIRSGKASVVTDEIDTFTETGLRLKSGQQLEADIIITATGLQLQVFGGVELKLDGQPREVSQLMTYKGVLLQDVPNMAWVFGYTNAPWTLKADIAAGYLCRLMEHMEKNDLQVATPRAEGGAIADETILDSLNAGYVRRAKGILPRQGEALPWRVLHDYEKDSVMLLQAPIDDPALEFQPRRSATAGKSDARIAA
jgi:monooxygenase